MRETIKDRWPCQDCVAVECSESKILLCFWFSLVCASCFIEPSTICSGTKRIWQDVDVCSVGCGAQVVTKSSCPSALPCFAMQF
ncbi:hypothetical protein IMY05_005G0142800 [Salix suchowensis]|nr:hypothetical protein IMY05_005G0142800 [Salix suchowensis]